VAPTVAYYGAMDPRALWQAGGATALFIAAFGAAGYATRRDLTGVARVSFWALVALIAAGLVAIALPFIAARDTARQFSAARQLEPTLQHPVVSSTAGSVRPAGARVRTYAGRSPLPVRND
jgi:hypothetical protein